MVCAYTWFCWLRYPFQTHDNCFGFANKYTALTSNIKRDWFLYFLSCKFSKCTSHSVKKKIWQDLRWKGKLVQVLGKSTITENIIHQGKHRSRKEVEGRQGGSGRQRQQYLCSHSFPSQSLQMPIMSILQT